MLKNRPQEFTTYTTLSAVESSAILAPSTVVHYFSHIKLHVRGVKSNDNFIKTIYQLPSSPYFTGYHWLYGLEEKIVVNHTWSSRARRATMQSSCPELSNTVHSMLLLLLLFLVLIVAVVVVVVVVVVFLVKLMLSPLATAVTTHLTIMCILAEISLYHIKTNRLGINILAVLWSYFM